jgi:hypothetical protein
MKGEEISNKKVATKPMDYNVKAKGSYKNSNGRQPIENKMLLSVV